VIFGQHTFSGVIDGYSNSELNICTQFGEESKLIETILTGNGGNFSYKFVDSEKGLYRVFLENQSYFDIIYNGEDIHIKTNTENPQYNMVVLKSEENSQLYAYLVENYIYDYKIDILTQLLEIYPDGKFYKKIQKELNTEVKFKNNNIDKVIKQNPESFAGRYLKAFRVIQVSDKLNELDKRDYLAKKYFEFYSIDDMDLLHSNAYNEIVLNYFKLFKSNEPEVYYTAAKTILDEIFFGEPDIFNFIFEYILTGFESLGLDEPAAKLSVEFGDLCSDGNENLKMRIKSNTLLSIGVRAPEITSKTVKGEEYTLSEMSSDYTLIVFWATWCQHCQITLPRLAAAQTVFNDAGMDILAISIDSDKTDLDAYLLEYRLPWKIICEYEGWDGKIVKDYAVFATPWMIIVDRNMNIVAKPFNEEKLYDVLEEIIIKKMPQE
jgi:peroxiredoxin